MRNVKPMKACKCACSLSHWQKASPQALFIVVTGGYARTIERKRSVKTRTLTNKLLGVKVKELNKWADRIYSENDFGRSVATSLSGGIGLAVYLLTNDWVLSAFGLIISFPIIRILSSGINEKRERNKQRAIEKERLEYSFGKLTTEEKEVVKKFVEAGGSVLTWHQVNQLDVNSSAIESLLKREMLFTSYTADGLTETFVLEQEIFDIGYEKYNDTNNS